MIVDTLMHIADRSNALGGDMKKVLGILAVSAALVGFTACGGDDEAEAEVTVKSAIVLATEEAVTAMGGTLDVDCAIKAYAEMNADDSSIMVENIDSLGDDSMDPAELGMSEEGIAILEEVTACISIEEGATEDMSEETTP